MNFRDIRDLSKDDILDAIGLQAKPSTGSWMFGTIGLFGLGLLVGAGMALMLTPKTGIELRQQLNQKIRRAKEMAGNGHQSLESGV